MATEGVINLHLKELKNMTVLHPNIYYEYRQIDASRNILMTVGARKSH